MSECAMAYDNLMTDKLMVPHSLLSTLPNKSKWKWMDIQRYAAVSSL